MYDQHLFYLKNLMTRKLKNEELGRKTIDEFKSADKAPFIVVLDNVRSMNNIGSIFRTCDAFRVGNIYLCGFTAVPPHKEIHKTALGAEESVDWNYSESTTDAVKRLKKLGFTVIAVEQTEGSKILSEYIFSKNKHYAFVFGNEIHGVGQDVIDICDECIEIPQFGTKHSFNIVVSAGIVLWEATQQITK